MIQNSRFAKVAVSAGLIVASGAAVLGITSFASAQLAADRGVQVATSDTVAPNSAETVNDDPRTEATSRPPRFDRLSVVATALDMTETDLLAELKAGKSIADVAKDRNVDLDTVISAITTKFKAHLDEEVTSGRISREVADAKLVLFTARTTDMVNTKGILDRPHGEGRGKGHGPRFASENLAKTLTVTVDELRTQLGEGKSLADIATAEGVDIADVKATLTADFKAHLAEEVASGEHTQDEADAKLAEFTSRLDDLVNGVRPARGPGMDGPGKGGHGRDGHGRDGHRHGGRDGMDGPMDDQPDDPETEGASIGA